MQLCWTGDVALAVTFHWLVPWLALYTISNRELCKRAAC